MRNKNSWINIKIKFILFLSFNYVICIPLFAQDNFTKTLPTENIKGLKVIFNGGIGIGKTNSSDRKVYNLGFSCLYNRFIFDFQYNYFNERGLFSFDLGPVKSPVERLHELTFMIGYCYSQGIFIANVNTGIGIQNIHQRGDSLYTSGSIVSTTIYYTEKIRESILTIPIEIQAILHGKHFGIGLKEIFSHNGINDSSGTLLVLLIGNFE